MNIIGGQLQMTLGVSLQNLKEHGVQYAEERNIQKQ